MGSMAVMITDPTTYQFLILRKAMKLYVDTGLKVNRNYTPYNMMRTATKFTGIFYKRGQLRLALDDMNAIYKGMKEMI